MADFKLISADSHLNEPPAAWERAQKEYGERAPRIVRDPPGMPKGLWLVTEGLSPLWVSTWSMGKIVGKRENTGKALGKDASATAATNAGGYVYADSIRFHEDFRYEDYRGHWDPAARLKDQDQDGVEAEVLYPSPGMNFYHLTDEPFQRAIFRSYTAWLHEFRSYNPKRLIGLAPLSILDIEHAVADVQEYAKLGFRGVVIPTRIKDSGYYEPRYEPLWAAIAETGMVINEHTGVTQGGAPRRMGNVQKEEDRRKLVLGWHVSPLPAQQFLGSLIFTGVFDRHPNLKVVSAEYDVGWVAHLVQQVDYWFGLQGGDAHRGLNKREPSEYFKNNIFFTFQDDRVGMLTTPVYGEDNFLFASDYSHKVTTWPYSHRNLDANCEGLKPQVKRKVGRENVNKVFNLGL
jgi:predicted TIM-barrel fold metal-dependent hydrolase